MRKPIAIFMNQKCPGRTFEAYDQELISALQEIVNLSSQVFVPEEMEAQKETLAQVEYIFATWGMPTLTEEEINTYLPNLKAVFYAAGSVQYFARPYLRCGVRIFSAWGANGVPVAEYTVSQILLAGKGYFQCQRKMKSGRFAEARAYCDNFPCNYHSKVGILGVGMIGSMVLERLKSYDLTALAYDPFASDEKLQALGAKRATLEEIFSQCQTISNHIANLPATQGMLHYGLFSKMKPSATFINTGRGAQVVEADLIRALKEEPNRTALLDVTLPEPPVDDSPLWTMPNVFLTPHIAGSIHQEVFRMGAYMLEECKKVLENRPAAYEVTEQMLENMA